MLCCKSLLIIILRIMRKLLLIFLAHFICSFNFYGEGKHFVGADNLGEEGNGSGQSVVADKFGNVYTLGVFEGVLDFDSGDEVLNLYSTGGKDVFIQKTDSNGVFIWAKSFGGEDDDYGNGLALDKNNDIIIVGSFSKVVDFNFDEDIKEMISKGSEDIFIQKVSAEGRFVWVKAMGGRFSDYGMSVAIDNENNIYTTGSFSLTVDFNEDVIKHEMTSLGNSDVFIQKINEKGEFIWAKSIGGLGFDYGASIQVDEHENVYVTGAYEGKVDFDPSEENSNFYLAKGGSDLFVEKLDLDGDLVWTQSIGGTQNEAGFSLALDEKQQVYITGFFKGLIEFRNAEKEYKFKSKGKEDIITFKQDTEGNIVWLKTLGGKGSDFGNSIYVDLHGDVFTTGSFSLTVDFNPGKDGYNLKSSGKEDVFVQKLNNNGDFEWAEKIGGEGHDFGYSIFVDYKSEIYTTGSFERIVTIQLADETKRLSSKGMEDVFIVK